MILTGRTKIIVISPDWNRFWISSEKWIQLIGVQKVGTGRWEEAALATQKIWTSNGSKIQCRESAKTHPHSANDLYSPSTYKDLS